MQCFESHILGTRETRNLRQTSPQTKNSNDNTGIAIPFFQEVDNTMAPDRTSMLPLDTLINKLINDSNNHIKKLLDEAGLHDIDQLPEITEETIDKLLFTSGGRVKSLPNHEKCEVRFLLSYVDLLEDNGKNIDDLDIYEKTEFIKFKKAYQTKAVSQLSATTTTIKANTKAKDKLSAFSCHRKLNIETYLVIKLDYEFTNRMIEVRSYAKVDKIDCVFDLNFDPSTLVNKDNAQLFKEQAVYAMVVAQRVFQSPTAKQYFQKYPEDVQAVF